jgi:hypothetical protein
MKSAHVGHGYVFIGHGVVRLVQLQVIKIVLAVHLKHSGVPDEIAFNHRGGGNPLKKSGFMVPPGSL